MMHRLTLIARNERGNSLVEMGLVAPILATFLVGMVDIGRAVGERLRIEQAAQRSIERVMQGQETSPTFANLAADAAAQAAVPIGDVTVTPRLECNGAIVATGTAYYTASCTTGQTKARYVEVAINRSFRPLFGVKFFRRANADGTFTLTGSAGVRIQ